jgi:co-chaperonin GroES (HSP10)
MAIKMLHNEVLVTATEKEETTAGGIILTGDTTKGSKPALVLEVSGGALGNVMSGDRVFLDWTKVMPIDYDGTAAGIIDVEHIKAVISV